MCFCENCRNGRECPYSAEFGKEKTVTIERLMNSASGTLTRAQEDALACSICNDTDDGGADSTKKMLLCDGNDCNSGWNMHCLDPPLKKIPNGLWYCPNCTPLPDSTARL